MDRWPIGAGAAVVGSLGAGLGENLIRLSFARIRPDEVPPPLWRRPLWVAGWLLTTVVTSVCAVVGLAFAPLQLLMPIGGLHILFGVGIAHILSGETLGPSGLAGAALVCVGVTIVLTGVEKDSRSDVAFANLGSVLARPESLIFFTVWLCSASLMLTCARRARQKLLSLKRADVPSDDAGDLPSLLRKPASDDASGAGGNGASPSCRLMRARRAFDGVCTVLHPVSAPALSGLLSAMSNLMLKLALSLASDPEWPRADKTAFAVLLFLSLSSGVGQVLSLNHSLECSPAIVVVPTSNSVLITVGSAAGLLFGNTITVRSALVLSVSIAFVIAGIVCLAVRDVPPDACDELMDEFLELDDVAPCCAPAEHTDEPAPAAATAAAPPAVSMDAYHPPHCSGLSDASQRGDSLQPHHSSNVNNVSFGSCGSNRSFAGYCDNISFNRHDNAVEFKKTFCELGKRIRSVSIRRQRDKAPPSLLHEVVCDPACLSSDNSDASTQPASAAAVAVAKGPRSSAGGSDFSSRSSRSASCPTPLPSPHCAAGGGGGGGSGGGSGMAGGGASGSSPALSRHYPQVTSPTAASGAMMRNASTTSSASIRARFDTSVTY